MRRPLNWAYRGGEHGSNVEAHDACGTNGQRVGPSYSVDTGSGLPTVCGGQWEHLGGHVGKSVEGLNSELDVPLLGLKHGERATFWARKYRMG